MDHRYDKDRTMLRLLEKTVFANNGCWLFTGSRTKKGKGYGKITLSGVQMGAHQASWIIFKGEIPGGVCVLHTCDTPPCWNPEHLFLGSYSDNSQDCANKRRGRIGLRSMAKLSFEQIIEIRQSEKSARKLSVIFHVTPEQINNVKGGRSWRGLAGKNIS